MPHAISERPALIKPVYDVSNFGTDVTLPLNCLSGSRVLDILNGEGLISHAISYF